LLAVPDLLVVRLRQMKRLPPMMRFPHRVRESESLWAVPS
jgi:hypothetical protein